MSDSLRLQIRIGLLPNPVVERRVKTLRPCRDPYVCKV
jgi:hypothetical protein